MKTQVFISLCIASILLSGCFSKKREGTITISGAFALYPMVVKWSEEYKKENPKVQFNITGGGAGKGMADALAGIVDLGMFSREITQEEKNKGVWWVGLTIDAVVPTVNAENPYIELIQKRGLTKEEFRRIFIDGTVKTWEEILGMDGETNLSVYTRSDACGAAETWAKYMGGSQEDLKGIGIYADPGLADAVAKDKNGVGFNNTIYAYDIKTGKKRDGIEIIPIDINGNGLIDSNEDFYSTFESVLQAIGEGVYPSPPARELYFIAKSKPQGKIVIEFIEWCLTDGQKFVAEAGYVPLKQDRIDFYLNSLR